VSYTGYKPDLLDNSNAMSKKKKKIEVLSEADINHEFSLDFLVKKKKYTVEGSSLADCMQKKAELIKQL